MAYIRSHRGKFQALVRIKGHPFIAKSFSQRKDAKRWSVEAELKMRREDAGIAKVKYPLFSEIALRYVNEVSIGKKCFRVERNIINVLLQQSWAEYPISKVRPSIIGRYKDKLRDNVQENTINRRLDVISTIFTHARKEWGWAVDNPVLSIRRPKNPEPRDRRISEQEIKLLINGNRTSELLRDIIKVAFETGMRQSEILNIHPEHIEGNTLKIPVAKTKPRTIPLTIAALNLLKGCTLPFNIDRHLLGKHFRRLCKHYGIKDLHFHDIRKNSLTDFMRVKNLNVADTMLIAGHRDPRMLLRVYNNLSVEHVAKKLNS